MKTNLIKNNYMLSNCLLVSFHILLFISFITFSCFVFKKTKTCDTKKSYILWWLFYGFILLVLFILWWIFIISYILIFQ